MQEEQGLDNSILYCSCEKTIKTMGRWLPCLSVCVIRACPGQEGVGTWSQGPGCPHSLGHSPGQCILAPGWLPGSGNTVLVGVGLT